jgi:integrating conjugative element protein (TIGR03758 family)
MNAAMVTAFYNGAGVNASSIRNLISVLAISFIFVFAAWLLRQMIEQVNNDQMDSATLIKNTISLGIVLSIVSYIILKN